MAGKACPSGRCQEGSSLLGIVRKDGSIAMVNPPLPVTPEFLTAAAIQGNEHQRFRFTEPCIEAGCGQWTGTRCGVIDKALAVLPRVTSIESCSLRPTCRWYAQSGMDACRVCPFVVADHEEPSMRASVTSNSSVVV